jgi:hypothetical protein
MVSFTPRSLYPMGKSPRYPWDRRLGGPQNRSGRCGVETNLLPLRGIELCPSRSYPFAISTEPSRFLVVTSHSHLHGDFKSNAMKLISSRESDIFNQETTSSQHWSSRVVCFVAGYKMRILFGLKCIAQLSYLTHHKYQWQVINLRPGSNKRGGGGGYLYDPVACNISHFSLNRKCTSEIFSIYKH